MTNLRFWVNRLRLRATSSDATGAEPQRPQSAAEQLEASALFDHAFYAVVVGVGGLTRSAAAEHFAVEGVKCRLPLNPTHIPNKVPDRIWDAAASGDIKKLLWWMTTAQGAKASLSIEPALEDQQRETATALTYSNLDADSTVRIAGSEPIRWGTYLDRLHSSLRLLAPGIEARPNKATEWNSEAEAHLLAMLGDDEGASLAGPLVSIIMPTWNREHEVAEAIRSVIAQSYPHWELLVVDDGSTDATREVVRDFSTQDARVRLIERPHEGVAAARNAGIHDAQGEVLAFLDSDNQWRRQYLALMVSSLRDRPDAAGVFGSIRAQADGGTPKYVGSAFDRHELLVRNYVDLNALVARTNKVREVGGFTESFKRWVDYDLVLKLTRADHLDYVPVIACDYEAGDDVARISTTQPHGWFAKVVEDSLMDAVEGAERTPLAKSPEVSVILAGSSWTRISAELARQAQSLASESVECIVAIDNFTVPGFMSVAEALAHHPHLTILPFSGRYGRPLLANLAARVARGDALVVLTGDFSLRDGAVEVLGGAALAGGHAAVQPLLSYPDGTLVSVGREWLEGYPIPVRFLAGLSPDDAVPLTDTHDCAALDGGVVAVRAEDWRAVGGFDVIFGDVAAGVDLSMRLAQHSQRPLGINAEARATGNPARRDVSQSRKDPETRELISRYGVQAPVKTEPWRKSGWEVLAVELQDESVLTARPVIRRVPSLADDGRESLRWAIKIGAQYSQGGDRWGDVPFANDLAHSLREFGHDAVVDRHHPESRRSASPDDVILALRGRHPIAPVPGRLNILWIISRPDLVSVAELDGYDGVFVASSVWARQLAARTSTPVSALLQAANTTRFRRPTEAVKESGRALFVGGARHPVGRQVVADALEAGLPLEVWGPRWDEYVPAEFIGGSYLPNEMLPAKYAEASVVLSDHFDDMARRGFINNRVFEALGAGARVISDPVAGLKDVFGSSVATYTSIEELRDIFENRETHFDAEQTADERAAFIEEHHSFDARARQIVRYVRTLD